MKPCTKYTKCFDEFEKIKKKLKKEETIKDLKKDIDTYMKKKRENCKHIWVEDGNKVPYCLWCGELMK